MEPIITTNLKQKWVQWCCAFLIWVSINDSVHLEGEEYRCWIGTAYTYIKWMQLQKNNNHFFLWLIVYNKCNNQVSFWNKIDQRKTSTMNKSIIKWFCIKQKNTQQILNLQIIYQHWKGNSYICFILCLILKMLENLYTFNKKPTNSYANKKNPFRCNNPFEIKTA